MSNSPQNKAADELRFTDEQFIWRFSPNQTDPELLEAIFVGRDSLLQNVVEKVEDSARSGSTHHVMLYGPRGIGKSHFIALLHHRICRDEKLKNAVHVAWLNEDETTTSMVQLLVRIYRALCKGYPDEYSTNWLNELLDQSPTEIAEVLSRRLAARFENRRLVILVENLNVLFENLGRSGQHELRTLLQEKPFACVIATTQKLFKAVTDRSEPFFGFFQQIPLKPLSLEEARNLLVNIARTKGQDDLAAFIDTPDGRGRVRAVHDLAGGNHRVYIVLSWFMTKESLNLLLAPFQKMADDLTPYYQERLRWISPLQRQIVELLCRVHGTVNPKEIARQLLLEQGSIGKQVRELEKIDYLMSTKRGRETFYELSEPLMRLADEVKDQSLIIMLVEFLRVWYRPDQLQKLRSSDHSPYNEAITCFDKAIELDPQDSNPRFNLSEAYFALQSWDDGFEAIREAFAHPGEYPDYLGHVQFMLASIFRFSEDDSQLQARISKLVDLYQQAAKDRGFQQRGIQHRNAQFTVNPLFHLADGLVKYLGKIEAERVTPKVLESYVIAVEQRVANLLEFEIALRLFRYGCRYLISGKESEFVELIQPERRLVRQALGLDEENIESTS